jgi:hypothetical protein
MMKEVKWRASEAVSSFTHSLTHSLTLSMSFSLSPSLTLSLEMEMEMVLHQVKVNHSHTVTLAHFCIYLSGNLTRDNNKSEE